MLGYVVAIVTGPQRLALHPGLVPRIALATAVGLAAGLLAPGPAAVQTLAALAALLAALLVFRGVPGEIRAALLRRV